MSLFNMDKAKGVLKKYGRAGAVTYLSLSSCVTMGFYVAIKNKVDVKQLLGMDHDPDSEPPRWQQLMMGPGSSFLLAVACSKACIPLKLPVAVALTPYVHRLEQRLLQRWGASKAAASKVGPP